MKNLISLHDIKLNDLKILNFCEEVGAAACPLVRELAFFYFYNQEVLIEIFEEANTILGIALLIEEKESKRALLVGLNSNSHDYMLEMLKLSRFSPDFWLLQSNIDLKNRGWKVGMEGNYYQGNGKDISREGSQDRDINFKIYNIKEIIDQYSINSILKDEDIPFSQPDVFRRWISEETFSIIVYHQGKPAGIAAACIWPRPAINFLYCPLEFRGQGLGTFLLSKLQKELLYAGYLSPYAMSPKKNQTMYKKAGFVKKDSWRLWGK